MAKPGPTIEDLVEHQGYPDEVAQSVLANIAKNKTADRIVSGELHLPHVQDAIHWHYRELNLPVPGSEQARQEKRYRDMEARIKELESRSHPENATPVAPAVASDNPSDQGQQES